MTVVKLSSGKITKWDDPAIKKLNPDAKLPSNAIVVVYRRTVPGRRSSSPILPKVSPDWKSNAGASTSVGVVKVTAVRRLVGTRPLSNDDLRLKGAPLRQRGRASPSVNLPGDEMALLIEMVVDLGVDRAELLQGLHPSKARHRPLSSSKRQVLFSARLLRPPTSWRSALPAPSAPPNRRETVGDDRPRSAERFMSVLMNFSAAALSRFW